MDGLRGKLDFSDYYRRGYAVGVTDIRSDCIVFFYRGEEIPVPSIEILAYPLKARFNGAHYLARIKDLRRFKKHG